MKQVIVYLIVVSGCNGLSAQSTPTPVFPPEICDNALDDDGDGLIDLNDPDCACPLVEPISLIPNPSFEDMNCCPENRSQLYCADTWIQASEATTDYIHTCGWMGWDSLPVPLPLPDGEACVGYRNGRYRREVVPNWKEYAGACLLSPLLAGTSYKFRFEVGFTYAMNSPPTEIVFYGTTDCDNLPFGVGDQNFGCPTNDSNWRRLGSVRVSGIQEWVTAEINIRSPQDIYAIAIGPNCVELQSSVDLYYFFDDLVLADQEAFAFQINPRGHPCSDTFSLRLPTYDTLQYQWYRDGIALPEYQTASLFPVPGPGFYEVRIIGPNSCQITHSYRYDPPTFWGFDQITICPGETYDFYGASLSESGAYHTVIKTADHCDSTVNIQLEVASSKVDSVAARIFADEQYRIGSHVFEQPGQYQTTLTSSAGCDSLVHLDLSWYDVYIPTAFSPNGDGINDQFIVYGDEDLIQIQSLRVFDRWGNLVYQGEAVQPNAVDPSWDGRSQGKELPTGLYLYTIQLLMEDGVLRSRHGSLSLLR